MSRETYNIIGVGQTMLEAEIHAMRHIYYFVERYHRKSLPPIISIKKRSFYDVSFYDYKYEIVIEYEDENGTITQ